MPGKIQAQVEHLGCHIFVVLWPKTHELLWGFIGDNVEDSFFLDPAGEPSGLGMDR